MILRVTIFDGTKFSSYLLHVSTTKDGVSGMMLLYEVLSKASVRFNIDVTDETGSTNGWGLEKTDNGYLFQLLCMNSINGFERDDGSVYSYKVGGEAELLDWPSVEGAMIPKCCFLNREQVQPLIEKLFRSDRPEESGGFEFDPNKWEIVSTSN